MSPSGIGLYILNSNKVLPNNSIITADNQLTVPKFIRYSGSNATNIGQLIGVDGRDITKLKGDPFITDNSGIGSLEVQSLGRFTPEYEGVHSCRIPDEHGDVVEFLFGIYQEKSKLNMIYCNVFVHM